MSKKLVLNDVEPLFENLWKIKRDTGYTLDFVPLALSVMRCSGPPKCGAVHFTFLLVILNLHFELVFEFVEEEVSDEAKS